MPGNSSAQLKLAQGRSRSSVRQRSAAHTISTTDFATPVSLHHFSFCAKEKFLFTDFRLAATLVNASVSWSTTSFVNLSALYSSFSLLIRIELGVQGLYLFRDGQQNNFYRAVTAHGVGMVFFHHARNILRYGKSACAHSWASWISATPRLNNLAFWLSVLSVQLLVVAMAFETGVSAGWTLYFPLTGIDFSSSHAVSLAILSLHLLGASSEAGAITFWQHCNWAEILVYLPWVETLSLEQFSRFDLARDHLAHPWSRNHGPLFRKAFWLFGTIGIVLDAAGDAVAFQHLFWFFGHP